MNIEINDGSVFVDGVKYAPVDEFTDLKDLAVPGSQWRNNATRQTRTVADALSDRVEWADGGYTWWHNLRNLYTYVGPPVPIHRRVHYGSKFRREDDEIRAVTGISVDGVRSDGTCWTWDEFEARCTLLPEED